MSGKSISFDYLSVQKSGSNTYLVSNGEDTIEVPSVAVRVIRLFDGSHTIDQVNKIIDAEQGTHIDIQGFLETLRSAGICSDKHKQISRSSQRIGILLNKICYNPMLVSFFFVLLIFSIVLVSTNFQYYFSYSYAFVSTSNTISIFVYLVISWVSVAEHEMTHYFSSEGYGASAHVRLGTRLQFLVAQATIDDPYKIDKKKRIKIYAIGMVTDLYIAILSILGICFIHNTYLVSGLRCLLYIKATGVIWQFLFYMKTDVYFIFVTLIGEYNLMQDAEDSLQRHKKVNNKIKCYSYFLVIGRTLSIIYFVLFTLPVIGLTIKNTVFTKSLLDKFASGMMLLLGWGLFVVVFMSQKVIPFFKKILNKRQ